MIILGLEITSGWLAFEVNDDDHESSFLSRNDDNHICCCYLHVLKGLVLGKFGGRIFQLLIVWVFIIVGLLQYVISIAFVCATIIFLLGTLGGMIVMGAPKSFYEKYQHISCWQLLTSFFGLASLYSCFPAASCLHCLQTDWCLE